MQSFLTGGLALLLTGASLDARQIDYSALWADATPFHIFLENVKAQQDQWRSRFANAAIDAGALDAAKQLPGKRRMLVVAEDRCSDSAWAVPYLAKLAAVVPEKLDLRVINRARGGRIQSAHLTADGRMATPTIAVLDETGGLLGAWVERPTELQKWFIANKPILDSETLHDQMAKWYKDDDGRSTIAEVLAILARTTPGK
jgi:hypothetical protein